VGRCDEMRHFFTVEAVAAAAADYVLWGWRTAAGGIVQLWVGGLDAWFCVDLVGIVNRYFERCCPDVAKEHPITR